MNANVSLTIHIGMTVISSMDAASFMSLNFHPCNVPLCNDQLHHYFVIFIQEIHFMYASMLFVSYDSFEPSMSSICYLWKCNFHSFKKQFVHVTLFHLTCLILPMNRFSCVIKFPFSQLDV